MRGKKRLTAARLGLLWLDFRGDTSQHEWPSGETGSSWSAGVWGSRSFCIHSLEVVVKTGAYLYLTLFYCPFYSVTDPSHRTVPPIFKTGLSFLGLWKHPP